MTSKEAVDAIIQDLRRIPLKLETNVDLKDLIRRLSRELQSQGNRGFSSI